MTLDTIEADNAKYFDQSRKVAEYVLTSRKAAVLWWEDEAPHRRLHNFTATQAKTIKDILIQRFGPKGF